MRRRIWSRSRGARRPIFVLCWGNARTTRWCIGITSFVNAEERRGNAEERRASPAPKCCVLWRLGLLTLPGLACLIDYQRLFTTLDEQTSFRGANHEDSPSQFYHC